MTETTASGWETYTAWLACDAVRHARRDEAGMPVSFDPKDQKSLVQVLWRHLPSWQRARP
jgi:hypothetical protein